MAVAAVGTGRHGFHQIDYDGNLSLTDPVVAALPKESTLLLEYAGSQRNKTILYCFLVASFGLVHFSNGQEKPVTPQPTQPIYASDIVTAQTKGHRVEIAVDITGAKDLFLVASDADDGFGYDWCDWAEPTLKGPKKSLSLTKLDWALADSGWGSVNRNANCNRQPMRMADKEFKTGFGTHANSVIHFRLPENHQFTDFTAIAGIDRGGTDQLSNGINRSSVRFLVFTQRPPQVYWSGRKSISAADHLAANAIGQFDVHPQLAVSLFAAEPQLANPSNIDIDHLGRAWVCEVLNYRGGRNNREQGDRILVLADTDGDHVADQQTVFYQGRDIDSIHGICVLGNRVLVSAGSEVFFLEDLDNDLKSDNKVVLFTGISGVQHDHGIHAFVFGPDGKLYFNFGNAGQGIMDRNGNPIIDVAGQRVQIGQFPYCEGMVFRCNMDGSQFETLGWNFRNNWEVCVDSLGRMWQSDNDDDGNRATRINYVMPYGNYGFKDEFTGAGWRQTRIGMADDVPSRHWHLNDPGVVPNLIMTGAGSPTGICIYEGDALPNVFRNQIIHCDAGPNVVRSYPVARKGAGFDATIVPVIDGSKHNQWFRPSDVCVAPDGSLLIADWYDPGVGGHGMGDVVRGRLFRVSNRGSEPSGLQTVADFTTVDGVIHALCSPNQATRFLAWQALMKNGEDDKPTIAALAQLTNHSNVRFRARAIWALGKLAPKSLEFTTALQLARTDGDPELRALAFRVIRQIDNQITIDDVDKSPAVNRELLVSLSHRQINQVEAERKTEIWTELASRYPVGDRWYLEALGIAAEQDWDACLNSLVKIRGKVDPRAWSDIVWRSRGKATANLLVEQISDPSVSASELPRYFRALELCPETRRRSAFVQLAERFTTGDSGKAEFIFVESIGRLMKKDLTVQLATRLNQLLDRPTIQASKKLALIERYALSGRRPQLLEIAREGSSGQIGVDAMATVLRMDFQQKYFNELLVEADQTTFDEAISLIRRSRTNESREFLKRLVFEESLSPERRKQAVLALAESRPGLLAMGQWVESGKYDRRLDPALSAVLNSAAWPEISRIAAKHFPMPATKDEMPLPRMADLLRARGNANAGSLIFTRDNLCSKCHVVNGQGTSIGPDLSEIGKKLSRQAMFESILYPAAGIGHEYQNWSVLTIDGEMFTGIIVNETDAVLELKDAEGLVRKIPVEAIEEKQLQKLSLMPEGMHKDVTNQELVDLVTWLMTLGK